MSIQRKLLGLTAAGAMMAAGLGTADAQETIKVGILH